MCTENHLTDKCPKLKELQENSIDESQGIDSLYYLAPRRPWKPRFIGMPQNLPQQFTQQIPQQFTEYLA